MTKVCRSDCGPVLLEEQITVMVSLGAAAYVFEITRMISTLSYSCMLMTTYFPRLFSEGLHAPISSPYSSNSVADESQCLRISTRFSTHSCVAVGSMTCVVQNMKINLKYLYVNRKIRPFSYKSYIIYDCIVLLRTPTTKSMIVE